MKHPNRDQAGKQNGQKVPRKELERDRRNRIKNAVIELGKFLPNQDESFTCQLSILQKSLSYLKNLLAVKDSYEALKLQHENLEEQIEHLKDAAINLKRKNDHLISLLKAYKISPKENPPIDSNEVICYCKRLKIPKQPLTSNNRVAKQVNYEFRYLKKSSNPYDRKCKVVMKSPVLTAKRVSKSRKVSLPKQPKAVTDSSKATGLIGSSTGHNLIIIHSKQSDVSVISANNSVSNDSSVKTSPQLTVLTNAVVNTPIMATGLNSNVLTTAAAGIVSQPTIFVQNGQLLVPQPVLQPQITSLIPNPSISPAKLVLIAPKAPDEVPNKKRITRYKTQGRIVSSSTSGDLKRKKIADNHVKRKRFKRQYLSKQDCNETEIENSGNQKTSKPSILEEAASCIYSTDIEFIESDKEPDTNVVKNVTTNCVDLNAENEKRCESNEMKDLNNSQSVVSVENASNVSNIEVNVEKSHTNDEHMADELDDGSRSGLNIKFSVGDVNEQLGNRGPVDELDADELDGKLDCNELSSGDKKLSRSTLSSNLRTNAKTSELNNLTDDNAVSSEPHANELIENVSELNNNSELNGSEDENSRSLNDLCVENNASKGLDPKKLLFDDEISVEKEDNLATEIDAVECFAETQEMDIGGEAENFANLISFPTGCGSLATSPESDRLLDEHSLAESVCVMNVESQQSSEAIEHREKESAFIGDADYSKNKELRNNEVYGQSDERCVISETNSGILGVEVNHGVKTFLDLSNNNKSVANDSTVSGADVCAESSSNSKYPRDETHLENVGFGTKKPANVELVSSKQLSCVAEKDSVLHLVSSENVVNETCKQLKQTSEGKCNDKSTLLASEFKPTAQKKDGETIDSSISTNSQPIMCNNSDLNHSKRLLEEPNVSQEFNYLTSERLDSKTPPVSVQNTLAVGVSKGVVVSSSFTLPSITEKLETTVTKSLQVNHKLSNEFRSLSQKSDYCSSVNSKPLHLNSVRPAVTSSTTCNSLNISVGMNTSAGRDSSDLEVLPVNSDQQIKQKCLTDSKSTHNEKSYSSSTGSNGVKISLFPQYNPSPGVSSCLSSTSLTMSTTVSSVTFDSRLPQSASLSQTVPSTFMSTSSLVTSANPNRERPSDTMSENASGHHSNQMTLSRSTDSATNKSLKLDAFDTKWNHGSAMDPFVSDGGINFGIGTLSMNCNVGNEFSKSFAGDNSEVNPPDSGRLKTGKESNVTSASFSSAKELIRSYDPIIESLDKDRADNESRLQNECGSVPISNSFSGVYSPSLGPFSLSSSPFLPQNLIFPVTTQSSFSSSVPLETPHSGFPNDALLASQSKHQGDGTTFPSLPWRRLNNTSSQEPPLSTFPNFWKGIPDNGLYVPYSSNSIVGSYDKLSDSNASIKQSFSNSHYHQSNQEVGNKSDQTPINSLPSNFSETLDKSKLSFNSNSNTMSNGPLNSNMGGQGNFLSVSQLVNSGSNSIPGIDMESASARRVNTNLDLSSSSKSNRKQISCSRPENKNRPDNSAKQKNLSKNKPRAQQATVTNKPYKSNNFSINSPGGNSTYDGYFNGWHSSKQPAFVDKPQKVKYSAESLLNDSTKPQQRAAFNDKHYSSQCLPVDQYPAAQRIDPIHATQFPSNGNHPNHLASTSSQNSMNNTSAHNTYPGSHNVGWNYMPTITHIPPVQSMHQHSFNSYPSFSEPVRHDSNFPSHSYFPFSSNNQTDSHSNFPPNIHVKSQHQSSNMPSFPSGPYNPNFANFNESNKKAVSSNSQSSQQSSHNASSKAIGKSASKKKTDESSSSQNLLDVNLLFPIPNVDDQNLLTHNIFNSRSQTFSSPPRHLQPYSPSNDRSMNPLHSNMKTNNEHLQIPRHQSSNQQDLTNREGSQQQQTPSSVTNFNLSTIFPEFNGKSSSRNVNHQTNTGSRPSNSDNSQVSSNYVGINSNYSVSNYALPNADGSNSIPMIHSGVNFLGYSSQVLF